MTRFMIKRLIRVAIGPHYIPTGAVPLFGFGLANAGNPCAAVRCNSACTYSLESGSSSTASARIWGDGVSGLIRRLKMDINFLPNQGEAFCIEVGFFDTILEIKQKVERYREIPVSDQKLIFNGDVLSDDLNIHDSEILNRSTIYLHLPCEEAVDKIHLVVKMPPPKAAINVEMNTEDTIHKLKEKIQEMEGIPMARLVFNSKGVELCDHKTLQECEVGENGVIDVGVRSAPATASSRSSSGSASSGGSKKMLKIMVVTNAGGEKTPVEVCYTETIGELRKKLEKMELDLPKEGYFFIYKQNVMDDDRSFRWHRVGQGDSIEVFCGTVSGGS